MPVRGNQFITLPTLPTLFQDPTWNMEDIARLDTLRCRFPKASIDTLVCWVWKQKVPGLTYTEVELAKLSGS